MIFLHEREHDRSEGGYSLVELLVAVAVFVIVVLVAVGTLISILQVNLKTRNDKLVFNNINYAVESITRTIREVPTSGSYTIGDSGLGIGSMISFTDYSDDTIVYRWVESGGVGKITREVNGGGQVDVTAPDVDIDYLSFELIDSSGLPNEHNKILLVANGTLGDLGTVERSDFTIQTTISQNIYLSIPTSSFGPPSQGIPFCGIPDIPGVQIENFEAEKVAASTLEGRAAANHSLTYTFDEPIPAGEYDVLLAAWDHHCFAQEDGTFTGCAEGVSNNRWAQNFERITAKLIYEGGSTEYVPGITDDLPCGENFKSMLGGAVPSTAQSPSNPDVWMVWPNTSTCWDDWPDKTDPNETNPSCTVNDPSRWPWGWGEVSSPMECLNYFDETHDFSVGEVDTGSLAITGVTVYHAGCDENASRDSSHPYAAAWGSDTCPEPDDLAGWPGNSVVPACIGFLPLGATPPAGGVSSEPEE